MDGENPNDGGAPPEGGEPPVTPSAAEQFDRGKLHPALRDMKPEEITDLFETMATSIRTIQSQPREPARSPMDELSGVPAHARAAEPPPRVERMTKEQYKEMLDPSSDAFDPETAFRRFAEQNYGNLVGDINARSIRGLFGTFRTEFPDFKDFESDVMEGLKGRDPASLTERDVLQTYLTAKGLRATLAERTERARKATATLEPSPPKPPAKPEEQLSDLEKQVADKMFRRIPDQTERYKQYAAFAAKDAEGGMVMNVPIGGGKKA